MVPTGPDKGDPFLAGSLSCPHTGQYYRKLTREVGTHQEHPKPG